MLIVHILSKEKKLEQGWPLTPAAYDGDFGSDVWHVRVGGEYDWFLVHFIAIYKINHKEYG